MANKQFTICALFYGKHPDLAERLLESLGRAGWADYFDMRVGLNNVCRDTETVLRRHIYVPITDVYRGEQPYYKYPLMRRMFHGTPDATLNDGHPGIDTKYTIWFDDDSWLLDSNRDPQLWFGILDDKMQNHAMVGAPYLMNLRGHQAQYIRDQPWFNGKPVPQHARISFITGGWWCIRTDILKRHDWPPKDFEHNGGDVMLGALCHQHGYKMGKFTTGLAINANESGKCSTASRRGFSQQPIGVTYRCEPPEAPAPRIRNHPTLFDVLDGKHVP